MGMTFTLNSSKSITSKGIKMEADSKTKSILRERFAEVSHEIWASWMTYMFSRCEDDDLGFIISRDDVARWQRQRKTPYSKLTEKEKVSDREQADKIMEVVYEYLGWTGDRGLSQLPTKENKVEDYNMTDAQAKVWDELQEAKEEIRQQNKVIEMLKESQQFITSDSEEKPKVIRGEIPLAMDGTGRLLAVETKLNTLEPLDRITSNEYDDHLHQAVVEARALYNSTVEGSPLYHGLQSIAQSQIAIVLLLEQFVKPEEKEEWNL